MQQEPPRLEAIGNTEESLCHKRNPAEVSRRDSADRSEQGESARRRAVKLRPRNYTAEPTQAAGVTNRAFVKRAMLCCVFVVDEKL